MSPGKAVVFGYVVGLLVGIVVCAGLWEDVQETARRALTRVIDERVKLYAIREREK